MSTNPIPPYPLTGPGSDPNNPGAVDDPDLAKPDVDTPPGDDSPLSVPEPQPDADEDPNEQLPRE